MMEIAKTIESVRGLVRAARVEGGRVGLVPTMGALHSGHVSLIRRAAAETDFVVVSIFVNPTQFGPGEDFEKYPRPIDADFRICEEEGVDVVFAPSAEEMYGGGCVSWVNVEGLSEGLCGAGRVGHFRGVTTVCAKLFNIVGPDAAFFGQKDGQQAMVITRMVSDLNMDLEIVVCPTVRESGGLAISSRNKYLSEEQKKEADFIYKSLQLCRERIEGGCRDSEAIIADMREILGRVGSIEIEYVSIVDGGTLEAVGEIKGLVLAAVAVKIGDTRLIDNILVDVSCR